MTQFIPPKLLYFIFSSLCLLILAQFIHHNTVPFEDAAILFRYAQNLATYGNIGFNQLVVSEGATDFGWMLLISGSSFLGFSEHQFSLMLTLITVNLFVIATSKSLSEVLSWIIAFLLLPQFYAGLGGFSVVFCGVIYMFLVRLAFAHKNLNLVMIVSFALVFLRPDFLLFVLPINIYVVVQNNFKITAINFFSFVALLITGLCYLIWRYNYFSELLPLPFYVKTDGSRDLGVFFSSTVWMLFLPYIFISSVLFLHNRILFRRFFLITGGALLIYCTMRLDQNIGNRFFGPFIFSALALVSLKDNANEYCSQYINLFIVFLSCTTLLTSAGLGPRAFFDVFDSKYDRDHELGLSLRGGEIERLLVTEAGRIPYYSELHSIDVWGLNSPKYAKYPFNYTDVIYEDWDIAVVHCPINWFKADFDATQLGLSNERNWGEMCKRLARAIHMIDDAKLYLYRYRNPGSLRSIIQEFLGKQNLECYRHDIIVTRNSNIFIPASFQTIDINTAIVAEHDWDELCLVDNLEKL